jgi:diguanylate cyclase (GGDEF)-like protein/PAS domain S-box-containing protein
MEVYLPDSPVRIQLLPPEVNSSGESVPSFHERLLDSLYDGVYFVDRERRIQYWNHGAELLTGYSASEVIGRHCFDNFFVHVNEEGCALCLNGCPLTSTIADGKRREDEVYLRHKLGHRVPVSVRVSPIVDSAGCILGAVEVFSDVTAKKNIERRVGELENLAFFDAVTGVPNRRYAELKVKQALQEVEQFGRNVGLLMLDVDEFKQVNDKYGHEIGDDALRTVCKTLAHNLRPGDTVGRWGGEEFLVIVADVNLAALGVFAERCRMLIAESAVPVKNEHHRITVSLGATLMKQGDSDQSAIKRADELMYKSKMSGRNRVTCG